MSMKRSTKLKYKGVKSRSLRREMAELDKHPKERFVMEHTVPKPKGLVKNAAGKLVEYEGP